MAYAAAKTVAGKPLPELPRVRARLAEAEAFVEGARAHLLDVARPSWAKQEAGFSHGRRPRPVGYGA